jgi:ABC-type phosphate/phosphonate transport system substrate-binding protein
MSTRAGARIRPLRVASHLAPGVEPLYAFLADYLAERLGRRAEFVVAESYERCALDIDDVCFVCSVPYLLFADAGRIDMEVVAAPVLLGDRYGGKPIYFSDVIVAADSRHRSFADLRGSSWAFNEPFSHSGYVTVLNHLATLGEGLSYFEMMVEAGFHQEAIRMVADGAVDAAAIDSQVLDIELRDQPRLSRAVRRIETIGPSTIQPVVVSRTRLSNAERRTIIDALLSLANDPAAGPHLDRALVERFVAIRADDYNDIRRMLGRARAAGLVEPAWDLRWQAIAEAGLSAEVAGTRTRTAEARRHPVLRE